MAIVGAPNWRTCSRRREGEEEEKGRGKRTSKVGQFYFKGPISLGFKISRRLYLAPYDPRR